MLGEKWIKCKRDYISLTNKTMKSKTNFKKKPGAIVNIKSVTEKRTNWLEIDIVKQK